MPTHYKNLGNTKKNAKEKNQSQAYYLNILL